MAKYEDVINQEADRAGIERAAAQALVDTENGPRDPYDVQDRGLWGGGSYGLVMVTLPTAREYGYTGDAAGLRDPRANVRAGLAYLAAMFRRFGSWDKAYAAYNAGPDLSPWPARNVERFLANLARWRERYGGFQVTPILRAGIGGTLGALVMLGFLLPELFKRLRRRRRRRRRGKR